MLRWLIVVQTDGGVVMVVIPMTDRAAATMVLEDRAMAPWLL